MSGDRPPFYLYINIFLYLYVNISSALASPLVAGKPDDEIGDSAFRKERGVEAQMIVVGPAPIASGIIVV